MVVALNYNGWRQQHIHNFFYFVIFFICIGGKGGEGVYFFILGNKRDILSYQGPNKKKYT